MSSPGNIALLCCGSLCVLSVCCCLSSFSLGFCLGLSLCLCGCFLSFALADSLGSFLIDLGLGVEMLPAGLVVGLLQVLLLGLYLRVPLSLPCIPSLVCDFLADGAFGNSSVEVLPQKNSLV